MTADADHTKSHCRWFQFRLRTLLIVITVASLPLAWVASRLQEARNEQAAIDWAKEMGGVVRFEDDDEASQLNEWVDQWFGKKVQ